MEKKEAASTDSSHSLQSQDTELIEESFEAVNNVSLNSHTGGSSTGIQDVSLLVRIGTSSQEPSSTDFFPSPNESTTKACSTPHDSKLLLSRKRKFTKSSITSDPSGECKKQKVTSGEVFDISLDDSPMLASETSPDVSDISPSERPARREGKKSVCFVDINSSSSSKEGINSHSSADSGENMAATVRCPLKTFNRNSVPRNVTLSTVSCAEKQHVKRDSGDLFDELMSKSSSVWKMEAFSRLTDIKKMSPDEVYLCIKSLENDMKKASDVIKNLQNVRKIDTKENIKEDKVKHLSDRMFCSVSYLVDDTDGELMAISLKQMSKIDFHDTKNSRSSLSSGSLADSSGSEPHFISRGPSLASVCSVSSTTSSVSSGCSVSGIQCHSGQFRIPHAPESKKPVNYRLPKLCVCQCYCSVVVDCLNKSKPRYPISDMSSTSSENMKSSDLQEKILVTPKNQNNINQAPVSCSENDSVNSTNSNDKSGFNKFRHRLSSYMPINDNLPVFAKWPANSFIYPGVVENATEETWNTNDSLVVKFCDGTERRTPCEHLFPAHLLPFGSELSFEEDGVTNKAKLISVDKLINNELIFIVQAEQKDMRRTIPFQKIFLSNYCFRGLKRNNSSLTPGKTPKFSISTANVQEGKRIRKFVKFENYSGKISSVRRARMKRLRSTQSSSDTKSARKKRRSRIQRKLQADDLPNPDVESTPHSNIIEKSHVNRKLYDEERPSCSQIKKKEVYSSSDSEPSIEVHLEDVYDKNLDEELVKDISQRSTKTKSLKRQNADLKNVKSIGPIPHDKIFSGYNFVLTHAKQKDITKIKSDSPSYSDEESGTDMEDYYHTTIPFDYIRLKEQITKGGGRVYMYVLRIPKVEYDKTIVISDNIVETPNYLMAVSLGIPVYRHDLIINCCIASTHISKMIGNGMRLPLGRSLITCDWIDKLCSSTPLKGFKCLVALSSGEKNVNFWRQLLTNIGAVAIPFQGLSESIFHLISFIVGDEEMSQELKHNALINDIPVVSTTWVIQTVIHGKSQPYTSHAQYIVMDIN